jgi:hypothetical protein
MARFLLGILIGVGGTLAWQSHGEEAKRIVGPWVAETVTSHAPSVAWALPSWAKPPQDDAGGQTGSTPTRRVPVHWR